MLNQLQVEIENSAKLIEQAMRFISFVNEMDGRSGAISFRDSTGILGREEDYKPSVAEEARKELNFKDWKESWVGTGKIAECAKKAINKSNNLVDYNQKVDFKNRLNPKHPKYRPEAEKVLYDIYRNPLCDDAIAFAEAVEVFGAKYDTISFLFFIKDNSRFLPIRTSHYDKGFEILGINYTTSYKCSWENYQGYISIISILRDVLEDILPIQGTLGLIDAHSFVWIIQEDRFIDWTPNDMQCVEIEQNAEKYIASVINGGGGRRKVTSSTYIRSTKVVKETRRRANGICQYCKQPAPFRDSEGNPYLEVHHVIWLSRGGEDSTDNTVALCPNCHTRMHILDEQKDIELLKQFLSIKE